MLPNSKDPENASDEIVAHLSTEIAQLQLKAFSAQMNPHFVFNALAAVQYFITSGDKKASLFYLSIFSKLIRFYIKHLNKETVKLVEEKEMLNAYLILQKLRYNNQFDYRITKNETTENSEAIIPSFILQTFFENMIEHSIYNQYKNYDFEIAFQISKKNVLVIVIFKYNKSAVENELYIPDYRKQLIKWQDQIQQLNTCKNYKIKKKITFNKNCKGEGGKITLNLPNLSQ
jgi:LytS/YehU family sensor histidine kinase